MLRVKLLIRASKQIESMQKSISWLLPDVYDAGNWTDSSNQKEETINTNQETKIEVMQECCL